MNEGQIECACIAKLVSETVEFKTSAKRTLWAGFTAVTGEDGQRAGLRTATSVVTPIEDVSAEGGLP